MLHGHGGNLSQLANQLGCSPGEISDMSSNINPLGPPPGLIKYLQDHIDAVGTFPEVDSCKITEAFASRYHLDPKRVLAGNGTTQLIYMLPQALALKRVLISGPTYSDYADACLLQKTKTTFVFAEASRNFQVDIDQIKTHLDQVDAVFICNPNNPTGSLISSRELAALCRDFPETVFIIDESYLPFVRQGEALSLRHLEYANLIVLSSISKIFAVPGLRIGFVISTPAIIERLTRFLQPWSVNSLAQLAAGYLMEQKSEIDAFVEKTRRFIESERRRLFDAARSFSDIYLVPSATNFMLAALPDHLPADALIARLSQDKILLRDCRNFKGLSSRYVRFSLKTSEANQALCDKLTMIARTADTARQMKNRIGACG